MNKKKISKVRPVYTLEEMVKKMKKTKSKQHPEIDWGPDVGEEIVEWNEKEALENNLKARKSHKKKAK